jgi:TPR repeat protein
LSNIHDEVKASRCVFCRTLTSDKEEYEKRKIERIEANDPAALSFRGATYYEAGDYDNALTYLTKAAELGNADAHYRLGFMYEKGGGVEKDENKAVYHYEKAAIGGHPQARHNLAMIEAKLGNMAKAVKHFIIAANLGYDVSMTALLPCYQGGFITKEEYGATLRTHQATINATKSSQREAAEKFVQPFLRG